MGHEHAQGQDWVLVPLDSKGEPWVAWSRYSRIPGTGLPGTGFTAVVDIQPRLQGPGQGWTKGTSHPVEGELHPIFLSCSPVRLTHWTNCKSTPDATNVNKTLSWYLFSLIDPYCFPLLLLLLLLLFFRFLFLDSFYFISLLLLSLNTLVLWTEVTLKVKISFWRSVSLDPYRMRILGSYKEGSIYSVHIC